AGDSVSGFVIATNNCTIRALAINRFHGDGVVITNGVGSDVDGCYLGVALDGVTRRGNSGAGIRIMSTVSFPDSTTGTNVIGGASAAAHNLISANGYGVYIQNSPGNSVFGNRVGADESGATDVGNTNSGVFVYGDLSIHNTIGGTNAGEGN